MDKLKQSIEENKRGIRKEIKVLKQEFSFDQKKELSRRCLEKIEKLPEFIKAKTVMMYWSMEDEVHTHDFVCKWANKKQVLLPCVKGEILELKIFEGLEHLINGDKYDIPEPNGSVFTKEEEIDLILVPGIAFDKQLNRMGRGKAYYDRLLQSLDAFKLGVCFDFQVMKQVPIDEHDIKMDAIVY